jgi:4-hydroxybenzoate polyprenyltransferase
LAIAPFFVVFVYYRNFQAVIFVHAIFLFLLILAREMIKDLENMAGDMAQNYRTIPILYGPKTSKTMISLFIVLTLIPALLLIKTFDVGYMYLYFAACIVLLVLFLVLLWRADAKKHYVWLHNIIKFIIVAGVFSILLIDVDVVLNRIL